MPEKLPITDEHTDRIFEIVEERQLATVREVCAEFKARHGAEVAEEAMESYMEWLRSSFPRKLAHAGPDHWIVVDLA